MLDWSNAGIVSRYDTMDEGTQILLAPRRGSFASAGALKRAQALAEARKTRWSPGTVSEGESEKIVVAATDVSLTEKRFSPFGSFSLSKGKFSAVLRVFVRWINCNSCWVQLINLGRIWTESFDWAQICGAVTAG